MRQLHERTLPRHPCWESIVGSLGSPLSLVNPKPTTTNLKGKGLLTMRSLLLKLHFSVVRLLENEDAQDLIEYALVVALIAFGATASMRTLATKISTAFSSVGTSLTTLV